MSEFKGFKKKGVSWIVRIIAVLALIIVSFIFLARFGVKVAEAVVDEKAIVDGCAATNKIRIGVEHATKDFVSTVRFCPTIDKIQGKKMVPSGNNFYTQNKEGAKEEIRDMIKNCWKMWVEGQEPDTFKEFPNVETCQVCYTFRIKDGLGVTLKDMAGTMEEPYLVLPSGDNCDPIHGGSWAAKCDDDELQSTIGSKDGKFCCYGSYTCENKGGLCSKEPTGLYQFRYKEWTCPSNTKCYVKNEEGKFFSYVQYITEFGERKGKLYVLNKDSTVEDKDYAMEGVSYSTDKVYAISFVSPSKQYCEGGVCKYLAYAFDSQFGDKVGAIGWVGKHPLGFLPGKPIKKLLDLNPLLGYVENFIVVSTFEESQELGCKVI